MKEKAVSDVILDKCTEQVKVKYSLRNRLSFFCKPSQLFILKMAVTIRPVAHSKQAISIGL